jgi:hypothetical protein
VLYCICSRSPLHFDLLINTTPHFPSLLIRRHVNLRLRTNRILALPEASHSLLLRIELHARLSIESIRTPASHRLLVAGEREHGQGDRDRDVDSDLSGFDFLLEAGGGRAGAGEDGGAVAVFVCVDEGDCVVERGDVEADEDGAEDLFFVAGHFGGDVCDYCGADLGSC